MMVKHHIKPESWMHWWKYFDGINSTLWTWRGERGSGRVEGGEKKKILKKIFKLFIIILFTTKFSGLGVKHTKLQ